MPASSVRFFLRRMVSAMLVSIIVIEIPSIILVWLRVLDTDVALAAVLGAIAGCIITGLLYLSAVAGAAQNE